MSILLSLWLALLPALSLSAADSRGPKGPETPAPVAAPAILPSLPALPGTALPVAPVVETVAPGAVDRGPDALQPQASRLEAASGERAGARVERAASSEQAPAAAPERTRRARSLELTPDQLRNAPPFIRALLGSALGASGGRGVVVLELAGDPGQALAELFGERPVSAPEVSEEERLFAAGNPHSRVPELFRTYGDDFGAVARDLIHEETFTGRADLMRKVRPEFRDAIEDILDYAARADTDPGARAFAQTAGVNFARRDVPPLWGELQMNSSLGRRPPPGMFLPRPALSGGQYWDLAAGMHTVMRSMNGLDPTSTYRFFDISHFAVAGINEGFRLLNEYSQGMFRQASAERQDVWSLERPREPLSVIRAKNVSGYVPGIQTKIEEMTDWIAPGGQLFIQNDGGNWYQRGRAARDYGPMARRLIAQGWNFDYTLVGRHGGLDLLTFARPGRFGNFLRFGRAASEERWGQYVEESGGGW